MRGCAEKVAVGTEGYALPSMRTKKARHAGGPFNTRENRYFFSVLPVSSGMLPSFCEPRSPLLV
jgi:hypothetical protein